jgi:dienelactone hydrolase
VTHRNVETLLGRLLTDPALRRRFAADPTAVLAELRDQGLELTAIEIEALASTEPEALGRLAEALDRRLRKARVASDPERKETEPMTYDPFVRGERPVGVRTLALSDAKRGGRPVTVELWYPASEAHRGQDLDPAFQDRFVVVPGFEQSQRAVRGAEPVSSGRFPLVVWSHGSASERREVSNVLTHLASHGYVVASADHVGDHMHDAQHAAAGRAGLGRSFRQTCRDRVADASFVIDRLLGGAEPAVTALVDAEKIGTGGGSFGGWTAIALNSHDPRPLAFLAAVPGWGEGPLHTELLTAEARLDDWGRPVAAFLLPGERDACVPLPGLRQLYRDLPAPKRFAVMRNASHFHGADETRQRYEMAVEGWRQAVQVADPDPAFDLAAILAQSPDLAELAPVEHAQASLEALLLAHMDASLKDSGPARTFLDGDLTETFAARGIGLDEVAHAALELAGQT